MKEKLSIEEIIAHCERVTKNYEKYGDKSLGDISNFHAKEYWEHRQVKEYLLKLKKYQAIGTPEECRAAVEKQTPFRPDQENLIVGIGRCKCGAEFLDRSTAYCGNCGQKLDWSEVE